jgi:hypothetical protein
MKIFIQARKDGYNVLYPSPTPTEFYKFASDIQSASARNDEKYYGNSFYTIAFADDGCIFSKYVIGYDVQRNNLGNVSTSIFISNTKKLSGENVKLLLDDLLKIYCSYCPNNYITNQKEDWSLFTTIANNYDEKLVSLNFDNIENYQSGNIDNAFIYYKDTSELQKYFDDPYQEEYTLYRQVLFISEDFKDKPENPLHALRHSENDLTGKIDLDNPKYTLFFNQNAKGGVRINVKVNGSFRSNKNKIRRKNEIEITWSKPFYKTETQTGKWTEIYSNYLIVNDIDKSITVKEIDLFPETKTYNFEVFNKRDNTKVSDAEIQIDSHPWQSLTECTFSAEELGREHKIVARKGTHLLSDVMYFKPQDNPYSSINLSLIEKKVVKIYVTETEGFGNRIDGFKVLIQGKQNYLKIDEVEFKDSEISQTWRISVSKEGFQQSEYMSYCPQNGENSIYFQLKNIKKSEGEVDPNPPKPFWGQIKTFIRKPTILASILVCVVALTILFFLIRDHKIEKPQIESTAIESYLDGDSLMMKQLKAFQADWNKHKPKIKKSEDDWFTRFFGGDDDDSKLDSTDFKLWNKTKQSIDSAIQYRYFINNKNFDTLKKYVFRNHSKFQININNIPVTLSLKVKEKLRDVSKLTLSQISDSINVIVKQLKEEPINTENNVVTSNPKPVTQQNSQNNTKKNPASGKNELNQKKWEEEFWRLIQDDPLSHQNDFDKLFKDGAKIPSKNKYKKFYDNLNRDKELKKQFKELLIKPSQDRRKNISILIENMNNKK